MQGQNAGYYQGQPSGHQMGQRQMSHGSMMRPQGSQQVHHKQMGMYGTKQRPNTLDLGPSGQKGINQTGTSNHNIQQSSYTSLNPFSSLFASGKKILEEATTPRMSQPSGQSNFGYTQSSGYEQPGQGQVRSMVSNPAAQQQNYYQSQQSHPQTGPNVKQQGPQSNQGTTAAISGALGGALKSIFKI